MLKVGIITGSTRPNRKSLDVAKWVLEAAKTRSDAEYELVDIKDFELPLLDEPMPPSRGKYQQPHTKRWAAKIASLDVPERSSHAEMLSGDANSVAARVLNILRERGLAGA